MWCKLTGNYSREINFPSERSLMSIQESHSRKGKSYSFWYCDSGVNRLGSKLHNEMCSSDALMCLFTHGRAWIPEPGSGISAAGCTWEVSTISYLISDGCGWNLCERIALVFVLCFSSNRKSWNEDVKWNVLPPEVPQMWPIIGQLEVFYWAPAEACLL